MRIAIMGTGGIGGYFGARLAAAGESVVFIARGAHLDAIRALPSFLRLSLHVEVGGLISRTTDMTNDAGWIDLGHTDAHTLREDERRLDQILEQGVLVF